MRSFIPSWIRRVVTRRHVHRLSVQEGYDRWAAHYDADSRNPVIDLEERAMVRFMPRLEGKRVLDAGCGTGRHTLQALEQNAGYVVGTDLSVPMLQHARRKGVPVLLRADLCALPLCEAVFDVVLCAFMLEHVRDFSLAIRELGRVTVTGGTILVADFHPFGALLGWDRSFRCRDGKHRHICTIDRTPHFYEEYVRACRTAGLTIEDVLEPGIDASVRSHFEAEGSLDVYERYTGYPLVLMIKIRKTKGGYPPGP